MSEPQRHQMGRSSPLLTNHKKGQPRPHEIDPHLYAVSWNDRQWNEVVRLTVLGPDSAGGLQWAELAA
jgi:hypothetical protein